MENKDLSTQDIMLTLNDHNHEIKSLKHRMDEVEAEQKDLQSLTLSVQKLAISMENMVNTQNKQGERLDRLEGEPKETWIGIKKAIMTSVISTVVGGIVGALIVLIAGGLVH